MHRGGKNRASTALIGQAISALAITGAIGRPQTANDQMQDDEPTPQLIAIDGDSNDDITDFELKTPSPKISNTSSPQRPRIVITKPCRRAKDDRQTTPSLLYKAFEYYINSKPIRRAREKALYLKERKALKTVAMIVSGFVACWLPFFIMYVVESACPESCKVAKLLQNLFLWLGYSNSILNPMIYALYHKDFRRCFRDLVSCGCLKRLDRTMSVRRLHQTRL